MEGALVYLKDYASSEICFSPLCFDLLDVLYTETDANPADTGYALHAVDIEADCWLPQTFKVVAVKAVQVIPACVGLPPLKEF